MNRDFLEMMNEERKKISQVEEILDMLREARTHFGEQNAKEVKKELNKFCVAMAKRGEVAFRDLEEFYQQRMTEAK